MWSVSGGLFEMEPGTVDGSLLASSALSFVMGLRASPLCHQQLLELLRIHTTIMRRRRRREVLERDRRLRQYMRRRRAFVLSSLAAIRSVIEFGKRRIWVARRNTEDNLWSVAQSFDDDEWKAQFRMSRATFDFLFSLIGPAIRRQRTAYRAPIEARRRLAIALWFYARYREYRHIAATFVVGTATVCGIVRQVTAAILAHVHPRFVSLPSGQRLDDAVRGFRARGYPQCAGAIGRIHVPIATPHGVNPEDYVNKRGWHSLVLQAVVNHDYCFTDVYAGWPGGTSAASVLHSSELYMQAEDRPDGLLFPREKSVVFEGMEVPVHLIGDLSFPLRPWLMKAYSQQRRLATNQRRFSRTLSSAQAVVNTAFTRLRGRWGYLLRRSEMDLSMLAKVVTACCVLHNLCEQCGDTFLPEWNPDASPGENHLKQPDTEPHDEDASYAAEAIRDTLSANLLAMLQD